MGDWKYWTPVKNITKGGPGSMSYPRPVGCCKASDEVKYTDDDGTVRTGCPPEWRAFIKAFEPKFTGSRADRIMGCSDGQVIDKKTKKCPGISGLGFDTPTGIQAFAEMATAV